ncbi:hypothetical protein BDM02DRAFT_945008 [Thelephora ganbajun]|uniref:Uncharacterized protein n=1 Tax=Thelephora ganbajun TaxID=370292 RepID=A0ACB6Z409_THEGA|nr:hypothetical protein BDM02DRAFT_945008 [Thelephora ganbajun]
MAVQRGSGTAKTSNGNKSEKEGVSHHDTLGFRRFARESELCISFAVVSTTHRRVTVRIDYSIRHAPCFDVLVPKDTDWVLPSDLIRRIQKDCPTVTAKQMTTIWRKDETCAGVVEAEARKPDGIGHHPSERV